MILPFHALRVVPSHVCSDLGCLAAALSEPAVVRVPVEDAIGIEYAFDLQLTQGFYSVFIAYGFLRLVRGALRASLAMRRRARIDVLTNRTRV